MSETVSSILQHKGRHVWSVDPDATVYDAIELMAQHSIGALLVIDGGRLAGIVTERDYARKVILHGRVSRDTLVSEIMSAGLVTVTPEHTVDECMQIITHRRIRYLPVLHQGALVGMLSIGDLVNSIISAQAQTIRALHTYIAGDYPA